MPPETTDPGAPAPSDTPFSPERLEVLRAEFPILSRRVYLNSCSLGALSLQARERLEGFLGEWHDQGAAAWYDHWLDRLEELRGTVARFLGAVPGEIALSPSTSVALSSVAESVDWRARPKVVTTELDFPTLVYQFAAKPEVELEVVRSDDGVGIRPEQLAKAVDERTAFLATSHVFFTTGFRQDLPTLARIARDAGALSLVDGYQAAGQVPVDLRRSGVDVYTAGPLKWLCGGPGLAYLYVREHLVGRLEPRITSWLATRDPFAFDPEAFAFRDDARRFEMGTPALPTVHTALGGQQIVDGVGIEAIHGRNRELTKRLVEGLRASDFVLRTSDEPETRTAIVMVAHARPGETVEALAAEGIVVDHRPGHVRISPHFYNTFEEIDHAVAALARLPR